MCLDLSCWNNSENNWLLEKIENNSGIMIINLMLHDKVANLSCLKVATS